MIQTNQNQSNIKLPSRFISVIICIALLVIVPLAFGIMANGTHATLAGASKEQFLSSHFPLEFTYPRYLYVTEKKLVEDNELPIITVGHDLDGSAYDENRNSRYEEYDTIGNQSEPIVRLHIKIEDYSNVDYYTELQFEKLLAESIENRDFTILPSLRRTEKAALFATTEESVKALISYNTHKDSTLLISETKLANKDARLITVKTVGIGDWSFLGAEIQETYLVYEPTYTAEIKINYLDNNVRAKAQRETFINSLRLP
ncbi:MAG: hypothetical protein M3Q79_04070 [bacterium]|nr:hypothetical protein [bacterium]